MSFLSSWICFPFKGILPETIHSALITLQAEGRFAICLSLNTCGYLRKLGICRTIRQMAGCLIWHHWLSSRECKQSYSDQWSVGGGLKLIFGGSSKCAKCTNLRRSFTDRTYNIRTAEEEEGLLSLRQTIATRNAAFWISNLATYRHLKAEKTIRPY